MDVRARTVAPRVMVVDGKWREMTGVTSLLTAGQPALATVRPRVVAVDQGGGAAAPPGHRRRQPRQLLLQALQPLPAVPCQMLLHWQPLVVPQLEPPAAAVAAARSPLLTAGSLRLIYPWRRGLQKLQQWVASATRSWLQYRVHRSTRVGLSWSQGPAMSLQQRRPSQQRRRGTAKPAAAVRWQEGFAARLQQSPMKVSRWTSPCCRSQNQPVAGRLLQRRLTAAVAAARRQLHRPTRLRPRWVLAMRVPTASCAAHL